MTPTPEQQVALERLRRAGPACYLWKREGDYVGMPQGVIADLLQLYRLALAQNPPDQPLTPDSLRTLGVEQDARERQIDSLEWDIRRSLQQEWNEKARGAFEKGFKACRAGVARDNGPSEDGDLVGELWDCGWLLASARMDAEAYRDLAARNKR